MQGEKNFVNNINGIVSNVIDEISVGQNKLISVTNEMVSEIETLKKEIHDISLKIKKLIDNVDKLEKKFRHMRSCLSKKSNEFNFINSEKGKHLYQEVSEIQSKFLSKQAEEKALREQRDSLERKLMNYEKNIVDGQMALNQITIAMTYLQKSFLQKITENQKENDYVNTIKILEIQEQERKRLAREIHDGPAQYLANASIRIDYCKTIVKKDMNKAIQELGDLKNNIQLALKEVRMILWDLKPMHIDENGLKKSIEDLVNNFCLCNDDTNIIDVDFLINEVHSNIDDHIQISIYRIIQEILNNIKKHSKAKNVIIKVTFSIKKINIYIKDDGIGFNFEEKVKKIKENGNSFGLLNLIDRISQLSGSLNVQSTVGKGTIYEIDLPLKFEYF